MAEIVSTRKSLVHWILTIGIPCLILLLPVNGTFTSDDARRDNSPASGEITPPKTLLHICQQNYKMKGEGISPALSV